MLRNHGKGTTTALQVHGKVRLHTTYNDGTERIEEWVPAAPTSSQPSRLQKTSVFDQLTLSSRKWKTADTSMFIKQQQQWEYEIGEPTKESNVAQGRNNRGRSTVEVGLLACASSNPTWHCEDSTDHLHYTVRNCPWDLSNYTVDIEKDHQSIVLRTKNKKFFKRWEIPALSRLNEPLSLESIRLGHCKKTSRLDISYKKPMRLLEAEQREAKERAKAVSRLAQDGDVDCKLS